jgi:hypothetical protein
MPLDSRLDDTFESLTQNNYPTALASTALVTARASLLLGLCIKPNAAVAPISTAHCEILNVIKVCLVWHSYLS